MYYEDLEYSLRLMRNGYRLKYVPESRIFHKIRHQANTPFTVYYGFRSRLILIGLCLTDSRKIIAWVSVVVTLMVRLVQWRIGSPRLFDAALRAIKDYYSGTYGIGAGS